MIDLSVKVDRGSFKAPIYECAESGHRFLYLTPTQAQRVDSIYNDTYVGFRRDGYFASRVREELRVRIGPRIPSGGRILDVGCGNGEFVLAAQEAGYVAHGTDFSNGSIAEATSRGLTVFASDFPRHVFELRYDLVSFWDVLEHLRNPAEFLAKASEVTGEGGAVLIKVPVFGALNFKLLRWLPSRGGLLLGAPGHLQYYTRESLARLVSDAGFGKIEWLPAGTFRQPTMTGGFRKRIGRIIRRRVGQAAGNENLYLFARKRST